MRIDHKPKHDTLLHVGDEIVEEEDEVCYLGSIVSKNGGADSDIESKIRKAHQVFDCMSNIW